MLCRTCGNEIPYDAAFCEHCGAPVSEAAGKTFPETDAFKEEQGKEPDNGADITGCKVTENICLCPDGKYRWVYEYQMLKNPTILITVLKAILLSVGIVTCFLVLINLITGDFRYWDRSDFLSFAGGFLILLLAMLALGVVSYLILAAIYGWSYQALLTMDEEGIELQMMKKDFRKAEAVGWLTAAAGLASGNISGTGTGILAATRDTSSTVFQHVRKVKAVRRRQVIYVNQLFSHNQVYAENGDFDFVLNYICEHVPETAQIKK